MVKKVLIYALLAMVILLVLIWLWAGGYRAIVQTARNFPSLSELLMGSSTLPAFELPWSPSIPEGPDISQYLEEDLNAVGSGTTNEGAGTGTDSSDKPVPIDGSASPYSGMVHLSPGRAHATDPGEEYLVIDAAPTNQYGVNLSGWSLQSALSGVRGFLPQAAAPFVLGTVNKVGPIVLEPGGSATVMTGLPPTGVSFRENICTGYLASTQEFHPPLWNSCPARSEILPATPENIRAYGMSCIEFVQSIPTCSFPREIPNTLTNACRSYLTATLSYNGCIAKHQTRSDFHLDTWRVYLAFTQAVWLDSQEVIRLLDENGRTVDVLTY